MKKSTFYRLYCLIAFCVIQYTMANAQTSFASLNYLYSISGVKTVAGIHNKEPNINPDLWTDSITVVSGGRTPALWSGDFLFASADVSARWTMIYEAQEEWNKGALINIMWHTCSPVYGEPCAWNSTGVLDAMTDAEWTSLITDGSALNTTWKSRLDVIAPYLQYLKDAGVEVFFRPFHEMNQPVFWWGGRPGANGTARLYQITHDYLTITKGLTNLIWVWDIQDFSTYATDLVNYNPGSNYWDVLAMDMYNGDGTNYGLAKYNAFAAAAGTKPVVIGECSKLPTSTELTAQPKWGFFMSWAETTVSSNSASNITALYAAANVITLDEMPGWLSNAPAAPSNLTAVGGIYKMDLAWTDNSSNEGGFTLDRSLNGSTWTTVATNINGNATTTSNFGLSAGTNYYYRIKATNSFGSSAWSNIAMATTVAGTATNVALNKTATASSQFNTSFPASKVVDGVTNGTSRWVSIHNPTAPEWITVDLGSLYYVGQIINYWEGSYATAYRVEISTDNSIWTIVKDKSTGGGSGGTETIDFTTQMARYVRVYCITPFNAPYGYSIYEIKVNAITPFSPVADAAVNITPSSFTAHWTVCAQVTSYKIDVATDAAFANLVTGYNNLDVSNATSYNVTGLSANTSYYYRVKACNSSLISSNSNTVAVIPLPANAGSIAGSASVCQSSTGIVYTVDPIANATTYVWSIPIGATIVDGFGTNSITLNFGPASVSGNVSVYGTGVSGDGVASSLPVTLNPLPVPVITGPATTCSGSLNASANTYTTEAGMTGYTWTIVDGGGTITAGGGTSNNTATALWTVPGVHTVSVNYSNTNGCRAAVASTFAITVIQSATPTLDGPTNTCSGGDVAIYTTQNGQSNFTWGHSAGGTVIGGGTSMTQSVTIQWNTTGPQWVTVNYPNAAGCSAGVPTLLDVNVRIAPDAAGPVNGQTTLCAGTSQVTYNVAPITGADSYVWTVPDGATIASGSGTNAITVNYGPTAISGIVSVKGTNYCGDGNTSSKAITVDPLPQNAGPVSGESTVCQGEMGVVYSIVPLANTTTYVWTIPVGANLISGAGTNSIVVDYSRVAESGMINVKGINACGNGVGAPSFAVLANAIPATPVISQVGNTLVSDAPAGNQWYLNSVLINGATASTYNAILEGTYYCMVTINGCPSLPSNSLLYLFNSLINQTSGQFEIYPVPNNGLFTASVTWPNAETFTMRIYNNIGSLVFEKKDVPLNGTTRQTIDMRPVPSGMYMVTFTSGTNQIIRKMVVNRD